MIFRTVLRVPVLKSVHEEGKWFLKLPEWQSSIEIKYSNEIWQTQCHIKVFLWVIKGDNLMFKQSIKGGKCFARIYNSWAVSLWAIKGRNVLPEYAILVSLWVKKGRNILPRVYNSCLSLDNKGKKCFARVYNSCQSLSNTGK